MLRRNITWLSSYLMEDDHEIHVLKIHNRVKEIFEEDGKHVYETNVMNKYNMVKEVFDKDDKHDQFL